MTDPLILFARITPKSEHMEDAKRAVLDIVARTRAEAGCRSFQLHEDRNDPEHLYLYEIWDDEAALAAHHAQAYTRTVFAHYENWLAAPVDITRLRGLTGPLPKR